MEDVTAQPTESFAHPSSSPLSLKQTTMHDESFSGLTLDDYAPSQHILNDSEEEYVTDDEPPLHEPTQSGRSSISSFPASIIHHNITPSQTFPQHSLHTPSHSRTGTPTFYSQNYKHLSPLSTREHTTGFRNPSSVRALQMRDELSDSEDLTPGHRRRGSRMSYISYRSGSVQSTPGKRMSRSLQGSPVKNNSRLRKEFPLVLLHCTMLPSTISPKAKAVSEELLEAIVPEPYKKRWKLLQEKVVKNFEVRERGVLIPHPREDYDTLEDRLLESLELEQPVISNGHFVGRSESRASGTDSGFGSEENSSRGGTTDEEEEDHRCSDCGGHICGERRWEVKVFAANGLLKAGAWNAAWSEMEKVDVQISVWLPEDVRQEIEARIDAVLAQEQELKAQASDVKEEIVEDERTREIYGEVAKQKSQEGIDGFNDLNPPSREQPPPERSAEQTKQEAVDEVQPSRVTSENINLQLAVRNYVQLLLQDRRNIAILLLCLILIFYGRSSQRDHIIDNIVLQSPTEDMREIKIEYSTHTIFSTSTSIAVQTSVITETVQVSTLSVLPTSVDVSSVATTVHNSIESLAASSSIEPTASGAASDTRIESFDLPVESVVSAATNKNCKYVTRMRIPELKWGKCSIGSDATTEVNNDFIEQTRDKL